MVSTTKWKTSLDIEDSSNKLETSWQFFSIVQISLLNESRYENYVSSSLTTLFQ